MHPSNTLETEPEIGKDYYYAASAVSPNAHHQDTRAPLFSITAAQTLEDQYCEEPESQQPFFDCLTQYWHIEFFFFLLGDWKIIAMKLIYLLLWQQFNILKLFLIQIFRTKMIKSLTIHPQMMMMSNHAFRTLQRPQSS
jgi:hypothetical protein